MKDVKLLRKLVSEIYADSTDTTQMFLRIWDIIDYLEGNKTPEFNNRIEKEYKIKEWENNKEYSIIDKMEQKEYFYRDDIEMGFSLDMILKERNRLEIPYKLKFSDDGKKVFITA